MHLERFPTGGLPSTAAHLSCGVNLGGGGTGGTPPSRLPPALACRRFGVILLLLLLTTVPGQSEEWTRFRGPNGTGVSAAKTIPSKWEAKDFNWKIDLPGSGHSSPVVWKDKIFLLSGDEEKGGVKLVCVAVKDGRLQWQ